MDKFIKHSVGDIKKNIIEKEGWGSYFIVDDFLHDEVFDGLSKDLEELKNKDIYTIEESPRIWREQETPGTNLCIGGAGESINSFDKLFVESYNWKKFVECIYTDESYKYFHDIFSETTTYNFNVSQDDIDEGYIGCKISCQTNNYGDIIHPDNTNKVISYLYYVDNNGWEEVSEGGTDFWCVEDDEVQYDKDQTSMDWKYRLGRYSDRPHSLRLDEAEKIKLFESIKFKPNRLVGFVRTNTSYHSIPPRILPEGVTRDCFQINIWNYNRS